MTRDTDETARPPFATIEGTLQKGDYITLSRKAGGGLVIAATGKMEHTIENEMDFFTALLRQMLYDRDWERKRFEKFWLLKDEIIGQLEGYNNLADVEAARDLLKRIAEVENGDSDN